MRLLWASSLIRKAFETVLMKWVHLHFMSLVSEWVHFPCLYKYQQLITTSSFYFSCNCFLTSFSRTKTGRRNEFSVNTCRWLLLFRNHRSYWVCSDTTMMTTYTNYLSKYANTQSCTYIHRHTSLIFIFMLFLLLILLFLGMVIVNKWIHIVSYQVV